MVPAKRNSWKSTLEKKGIWKEGKGKYCTTAKTIHN
jgi:hypothetical protein